MELRAVLAKLKEPFPAAAHRVRDLPGGGKWAYVPWQRIRDRLDEICPEWECSFSDPVMVEEFTIIRCKICIGGICREGVGNAKVTLSSAGRAMDRGSPVERATADALKNAAEQFGVGAYLDDPDMQQKLQSSQYVRLKSK